MIIFAEESIDINDYNNDGFIDTLITISTYGSGGELKSATIINGKSKERFSLDLSVYFSTILDFIVIPQILHKNENAKFLNKLLKYIVPEEKASPDPSLEWMINGRNSFKTLNDNKYFWNYFSSNLNWEDSIKLPASYSLKYTNGIYSYMAHNHYQHLNKHTLQDSLLVAVESEDYNILKTSHGLIANKKGDYKWIFVTDYGLTGAPSKLRWSSIGNIILKDKYLLLTLDIRGYGSDFEHSYFFIGIESGKVAKINDENLDNFIKTMTSSNWKYKGKWKDIINEFNMLD